ncbi:hypothetical protein GWI33_015550 [Rhynchophorus ferrugineus]|uniref:Helicase SKI2W n=1 Tax=Rhynchophorus ferrugineus TaxID=354439 RepID=A0A834I562_RHYFE|nr:hypothetical protein GWI33_015550 [Rhynchophorus ferrugineus]
MTSIKPPPVLPDIEDDLSNYLLCPENLPIHKYERSQEAWSRSPNPQTLFKYNLSPISSTLQVQRDMDTGQIIGFREVPLKCVGADAKNSMSFNRAPAPPSESVRGSAMYVPFQPGSFPEPVLNLPKGNLLLEDKELLTVPPGFSSGLELPEDVDGYSILNKPKTVNLLDVINKETNLLTKTGGSELEFFGSQYEDEVEAEAETEMLPEEKEVVPKESQIISLTSVPPPAPVKGSEWAILLDATNPVKDFEKKIPEMAKLFPFELDTFQKLAILQLEQHNHVFVAAHTSAGKTVVAEYAIALSQRHMTRTIYTSPIKALSNQKYRDFKDEFDDVGLITGDFQINQKASCLIMTTEILRSMLYCGSDITRDLEYVIFDEVHYINDRERGHVWEQVLIMLPAHVCVVLLSATAPNTIEFADWLGRTHQRKVYVITTLKRPVPLQHFLYTGRWGGSKNDRFLVLDADRWLDDGYRRAKLALEPIKDKNIKYFNKQQEKTLWLSLIDHLRKSDLLPVVVFIFSRQKCDTNAEILSSLDLTTQKEKSLITMFFNKCIRSLTKPDQDIPQIVKMRNILGRGIGIHHSGVLPIVKEIVEMLFQRGLIKILFATETFAMGVNMPARTVIFDSIKKHDGMERRYLLPAEYIQMAGRAGRRGKDEKGTVIILCKLFVPSDSELKGTMIGLPSKLSSQFRLTYGMVLSLLRVESISVEGMMSRSFGEAEHQKQVADMQLELEKIDEQLQEVSHEELSGYLQPLVKFYKAASEFLSHRSVIMPQLLNNPKIQKVLVPGALVIITHKTHCNKLALILSVDRYKSPINYKVMVLTDPTMESAVQDKNDLWYQMLGLTREQLFVPGGNAGHTVITVSGLDIFEISSKDIKVKIDLVLQDWQKRQIERFKLDPPGQNCMQAIQELIKLSMRANENPRSSSLKLLHIIDDLKVNDYELYERISKMYDLKEKYLDQLSSTRIPNFEKQFEMVFARKFLEEKKRSLEYKLSNASLTLYPDYQNRIELLRALDYVDPQNRVRFKGNIACEMGMNELLITELVLDNVFVNLHPSEVAALLSALVFRARTEDNDYERDLTPTLKEGIAKIKYHHAKIAQMEQELAIQTDEFQSDLNFALVHVVYRWANMEAFAEIMKLTEVQEGIIVRCIQQLNETIIDVRDAAKIIGDPALQKKMEDASATIKRNIVFAESLYTQEVKL